MKLFLESFRIFTKCRRMSKKFYRGLKFEFLLKLVSGWVEGKYCVKGPYCSKNEVSGCAEDERCVEA